jgi:hypothetical protein
MIIITIINAPHTGPKPTSQARPCCTVLIAEFTPASVEPPSSCRIMTITMMAAVVIVVINSSPRKYPATASSALCRRLPTDGSERIRRSSAGTQK